MRLCVLFLLLAGCATVQPQAMTNSFNPAEVAWFNQPGSNVIEGNAVMRTVGGEVRTCAGSDANLIPVSAYASERMTKMFGSTTTGLLSASSGFSWASTDPIYQATSRTVTCDSLGNFRFDHLPDGDYYVTAKVVWGIPNRYFTSWQGGYLMRRIHLAGGETQRVVLSQ